MRAFISAEPPRELLEALQRLQSRLRTKMPDAVRWSHADQLHLTLQFLGDVDDARVPELSARLEDAVAAQSQFNWQLDAHGCFPNMRKPNVIWIGTSQQIAPLLRLHAAIKTAAQPFAEREENRPFHPHVTLGRVRPTASAGAVKRICEELQALQLPPLPIWPMQAIRLMQSKLGPKGAAHRVVAEFLLQP